MFKPITYEKAKEALIELLRLGHLYDESNHSVWNNNKVIVQFIDETPDGTPMIRADYSEVFDRWSVATYWSNYLFKDWLSVVASVYTMNNIAKEVCVDEELVDDDVYDVIFNEHYLESKSDLYEYFYL